MARGTKPLVVLCNASLARALAFPNMGQCTVMAADFADDPLDLVDHSSVLGLLKYVTQCSYWSEGWPNVKFLEGVAYAITRALYVKKDRKPQGPLSRLSVVVEAPR